jgi:tight adherence protein C
VSVAGGLAACAGVLAAAAAIDLISVARSRERGRRPRGRGQVSGALALLATAARRVSPRAPHDLAARLEAAGMQHAPADVMGVKAGLAAVVLLLTVAGSLPGLPAWWVAVGACAAAFTAPDLWLRRRRLARGRDMADELGDILELLRVAVDAGLSPARAMGEVGRRHHGPMAAELRRTAALVELGVGYEEAVGTLVRRCPAHGVAALVAALRRAERHGSPLSESLRAQAEEARARRSRAAAESAARAAPKIQLVVALLLVPSAMLLVAAAMIPALSWQ